MLSRRRLPHLNKTHQDQFVTWNLAGSLPSGLYPPAGKRTAGEAFVWMDRYLDTAKTGPLWLAREDVAAVVVQELVALELWDLHELQSAAWARRDVLASGIL